MNDQWIDLHAHSTASDGTLAPEEVVRLARQSGLSAVALTDHDTAAGIPAASAAAKAVGIDFLSGIEISAQYPGGTMHLLGYGVDPHSPELSEMSRYLIEARDRRNPKIIARLNELGVAITLEEAARKAGGEVVGRPHIAAVLLDKGYVTSIKQAFNQYLGVGGKAHFDKERLPPQQAIQIISRAGGLCVLAHPVQLRTTSDAQLERVIKDLVDLGLAGIEVIHSDHDAALVEKYSGLAERFGLLKTGGSDFHGINKKAIELGWANRRRIPRAWFDALTTRLQEKGKP